MAISPEEYISFRKEALMFAEYVGFGDVFTRLRDAPVADPSISTQRMRGSGCTNDKIDRHRKAYQFLRSTLKSKINLYILYRAPPPAEAWVNLESWHNPLTIALTQSLYHRFQCLTMRLGQNPMSVLTILEEMAAQLMQQHFTIGPNHVLI